MTNPTSAFGWQMPQNTDLVTDLPADFEVFGQAVDTSMADLLGGTTGQILSKASNTNMDFTWVTTDDTNAIQNAIVDAKGDLIAATAADTPARLAVGTNNGFLKADSSTATGLVWDNSAWTAYTPSTSGVTVGNGTLTGFQKQIGKTTFFRISFTLGSTSAITGSFSLGTPFGPAASGVNLASSYYFDTSTSTYYQGWYFGGFLRYEGVGGTCNATVPFTWATGDIATIWGSYEAS